MTDFKAAKVVAAVPSPPEPDTVYFVRAGSGFDLYVTNGVGVPVAYKLNTGEASGGGGKEPVMLGQIIELSSLEPEVVIDGMTFLREGQSKSIQELPGFPLGGTHLSGLERFQINRVLTGAQSLFAGEIEDQWFALGNAANYVSLDWGKTWTELDAPTGYTARATHYDGQFMLARRVVDHVEIAISRDNCESWEFQSINVPEVFQVHVIEWNPHNSNVLIGTNLGALISLDNGVTWNFYAIGAVHSVYWLGTGWAWRNTQNTFVRINANGTTVALAALSGLNYNSTISHIGRSGLSLASSLYGVITNASQDAIYVNSNFQFGYETQGRINNSLGKFPTIVGHPANPTCYINPTLSSHTGAQVHFLWGSGVTKEQILIAPMQYWAMSKEGKMLGIQAGITYANRSDHRVTARLAPDNTRLPLKIGKYVRIK